MTEEQINTGISKIANPASKVPVKNGAAPSFMDKVRKHIPDSIKRFCGKLYSNKRVFFPLVAIVCLLLIIVFFGLIFGNKREEETDFTDNPGVQVTATPEATESANIITITESELKGLGSQINSFDVYQYKLQPPAINFEIEF